MTRKTVASLVLILVLAYAYPASAQEKPTESNKWVIETGLGVAFSNLNLDLIDKDKIPVAETRVWGMAGRKNWLVKANLWNNGNFNLTGYSVEAKTKLVSLGLVKTGVSLGYSERKPRLLFDYGGKVKILEADFKRLAAFSIDSGLGSFDGNYLRVSAVVAYGESVKNALIYVDNEVINNRPNLYHRQIYRDEMFMFGAGLSTQYMVKRLIFSGSLEYLLSKDGPGTILPEKYLFIESELSIRVLWKIHLVAGGMYSNNPYGLKGSSYAFAGTSVKF